jgi:hypothetical protein
MGDTRKLFLVTQEREMYVYAEDEADAENIIEGLISLDEPLATSAWEVIPITREPTYSYLVYHGGDEDIELGDVWPAKEEDDD